MLIKKANAYLSILTTAILVIHLVYEDLAYCFMYYNPVLSKVTGFLVAACVTVHAVMSLISVLFFHDSRSVSYVKLNIRTVLQRISALIMLVLLPVHFHVFALLNGSKGISGFVLVEAVQAVFYVAVFLHVALSFSKSLITLGWIIDPDSCRKVDRTASALCLILCILTVFIIIYTQARLMGYG